jgi:ribonucleoside-diphosphate reductase alpha chain
MGVRPPDVDDIPLSPNARKVLERRYLLKDERGRIVETPLEMFHRVAKAVAEADLLYDKGANVLRQGGKRRRAGKEVL